MRRNNMRSTLLQLCIQKTRRIRASMGWDTSLINESSSSPSSRCEIYLSKLPFWFKLQNNFSPKKSIPGQSLSDASLACRGTWLLWPLLWVLFYGRRLLCKFGIFPIFILSFLNVKESEDCVGYNDGILKIPWFFLHRLFCL